MYNNPWKLIAKPSDTSSYNVRRVDPEHPFEFFWGRDYLQRFLFIMQFKQSSRDRRQHLPFVKGLELTEQLIADTGKQQIVVALREQADRDIFIRLCCDLLEATRDCRSERIAVATTINRLWRWQKFMQKGRRDKLDEKEQRGLIGELMFLRDILISRFEPLEAIGFWQGTVVGEGDKDFSVADIAVEIKTRLAAAPAGININSESQLDVGNYAKLILVVYELSKSSGLQDESFTLDGLVEETKRMIAASQPEAVDVFEARLANRGYSDLHDYSDNLFSLLGCNIYSVEKNFPKLIPKTLPKGVYDLKYRINLIDCRPFEIDISTLLFFLEGKK